MGFAPPPHDGFALLASAHTDAFARCPAPSRGLSCHVTTAAYSCVRGVYVHYDTKHDRMPRNTKKRRGFRDSGVLETIYPLGPLVATPRPIQTLVTDVATGESTLPLYVPGWA